MGLVNTPCFCNGLGPQLLQDLFGAVENGAQNGTRGRGSAAALTSLCECECSECALGRLMSHQGGGSWGRGSPWCVVSADWWRR